MEKFLEHRSTDADIMKLNRAEIEIGFNDGDYEDETGGIDIAAFKKKWLNTNSIFDGINLRLIVSPIYFVRNHSESNQKARGVKIVCRLGDCSYYGAANLTRFATIWHDGIVKFTKKLAEHLEQDESVVYFHEYMSNESTQIKESYNYITRAY